MADIEQIERTVEERLDAAEDRIAALDRDVKELWRFIVASVVIGIVVAAVASFLPEPQPSNRDATEQELLNAGVHCYDSSEERAAARQRALAATERMQWQQDRIDDQPAEDSGSMVPVMPPPPLRIPWIVDTPSPSSSESWDGTRCFSVVYGR